MRIGIVGGTGDIGEGMAMRLAPHHEVVIGSRESGKANEYRLRCINTLQDRGVTCYCEGATNQEVVNTTEVVILAIPFTHLVQTLKGLSGWEEQIVISPVNPMEKREFFAFTPPPEGGAALLVRRLLPPGVKVCAAFNTIAANRWRALSEDLTYAVPVCGDDLESKRTVMALVDGTSHLRAFDAGPLAVSPMVESLTPLLINIARYNRMRDVGIQFI
ncbi:MAG: NADPH-dependent F420 reductase [Methanomicrobiales archaeon]|nr:NADPH-dependent F420 reductase [Methanomicrobiales archaeon]